MPYGTIKEEAYTFLNQLTIIIHRWNICKPLNLYN